MAVGPEQEALQRLMGENLQLKQQVFELDQRLKRMSAAVEGASTDSGVIRVIKGKDGRIAEVEAELQVKRGELEQKSEELDRRSDELRLWVSTLRLYAEIFESEPAAMIGVNLQGDVVLFNRSATMLFGEKLQASLHKPIEQLDFSTFDPATPRLVRDTLARNSLTQNLIRAHDRRIATCVFPMGAAEDRHGALIRVTVTADR